MRRLSEVDYVVDDNGCWIWQLGRTGKYGYKWDRERKKQVYAHRWYWEQVNGPIPDGLTIDHVKERCHSKLCVNPNHLEAVTLQENLRRTDRRSGPTCKHGHDRATHTIIRNDGSMRCKACEKEWNRMGYLRRKAQV